MFKKLAFLVLLASSTATWADALTNGPYLAGHLGAAHTTYTTDGEKESDTRLRWDVALGARIRAFRFEAQFAETLRAKLKEARVNQQRYMAQFYYDFPLRSVVRPFLNAGLGASYAEVNSGGKKSDDTTFCWNVGAGLGLNLTRMISFDIGYRYINAGRPKFFDDAVSTKIQHHEGYAGIRFTF